MNQLRPCAGATKDSRCPQTILTSGHQTLTVTDEITGDSISLTPASLYHYRYDQQPSSDREKPLTIHGLAALDSDGLVLVDLPGSWHAVDLEQFARKAGIPLEDARNHPANEIRAVLAARAPGWRRVRGLPRPSIAKWRKPVGICLGIAGAGLMVYLASLGMWTAWRGLSTIGRVIVDLLEAKWLLVAFSPALLLFRPALAKLHRRRVRRGTIVGPYGGPYLSVRSSTKLHITQGTDIMAKLRLGENPGQAFSLLLYRYEDLRGLLVLDRFGRRALHHLPGPWPPQDVERFAKRHNLALAVHRVSREEYLALTRHANEATP
ncbi:hypothetical protein HCN51_37720 [Nonomuraea sp. FMUSA5-5]|uniref:DUF2207 domain-containing protein n=1 Tax=Nonomuraea composti TaxID=2720023 RepID=A0ABX1BFH9_9ACTN|nr:hypothetical protein [Nonomuraea sp. FMUSA5-5]NJP95112.1 hypothetical protein [Nonomuraea sp. FMUSA5-5]